MWWYFARSFVDDGGRWKAFRQSAVIPEAKLSKKNRQNPRGWARQIADDAAGPGRKSVGEVWAWSSAVGKWTLAAREYSDAMTALRSFNQ